MSTERFSVLIGLHERRLAEARRRIGAMETAFKDISIEIERLQQEQLQAAAGIESWEIFRSIRRELKTFEQLQQRQRVEQARSKKRREHQHILDQALLRWLEASA